MVASPASSVALTEPASQAEASAEGVFVSGIHRTWHTLFEPGAVVEMRALKTRWKTVSGYFDNPDALAAAAAKLDGQASIYVTLNPPNPALLARAANRAVGFAEMTTADSDIVRRRWVLIDFDPVRPAGISSTDDQHMAALDRARTVREWLIAEGVPEAAPVLCDSGSGAHLLLRVDLPNTDEARTLVERFLEAVALRCGDDAVNVDLKTFNAARITKLYGTIAAKGDDTEEHPHRRSSILHAPPHLAIAPDAILLKIAALAPKPQEQWTPVSSFDLAAWLARFADRLGEMRAGEWKGGRKWALHVCPWDPAHTNWSAYVVQLPSGAIAAGCHHNGCIQRNWRALRDLLEPGHHASSSPHIAADIASPVVGGLHLTDAGNAELLVRQHGDNIRFISDLGKWVTWDGVSWKIDTAGTMMNFAKKSVRSLPAEAGELSSREDRRRVAAHWLRSECAYKLKATIELAQADPRVSITQAGLDASPWALTVKNGTINLKTGQLEPHRREDLITKVAPVAYDPAAECPRFLAFLDRIMAGNASLIQFLQRTIGYALTGSIVEQVVFILHGTGANGKSTLLETLRHVLGDYASQADSSTFLTRDVVTVRNDIARLHGARFVSAVEVGSGRHLDEVLVKQVTGGDTVTARFLYHESFEFRPTFKLFIACNHRPEIRGQDNGIWRRIREVPFNVTIPPHEQNKHLLDALTEEAPGILRWAVDGCIDWQRGGIGESPDVAQATALYRASMDSLTDFWGEVCAFAPDAWTATNELYLAYARWADERHERPVARREFVDRLSRVDGCCAERKHQGRGWAGIRLIDEFAGAREVRGTRAPQAIPDNFTVPEEVHA